MRNKDFRYRAKGIRESIAKNSLLVNALNLMLASGVTALFGFIFWTAVAHSFRLETVGLATTLLSMSALLSLLGLAGFDTIFVRFLPKSKNRNQQINSGLTIAGVLTGSIAGIFCLLVPVLSPKLSFIDHSAWYVASFIAFTIFTTWNTLTNAVLIAYRRTSFVLAINIIFSAVKMSLPFIIHGGGPMTIFLFAGIAQVVNVLLSVAVLIKYFGYRPAPRIDRQLVREMRRYGSAIYLATVLNLLPDSALPLIVVNKLGAAAAAYFYIAFTLANLLYTIAFATSQALLAEAAHDENNSSRYIRKALLITSCMLVPAIVFIVIFCPIILGIFGHAYRQGAVGIMRILSISGIFVMGYSVLSTIFKHRNNLKAIILMTSVNAVVIIALSLLFARPYGLYGIGWAWCIGTVAAVIVGYVTLMRRASVSRTTDA